MILLETENLIELVNLILNNAGPDEVETSQGDEELLLLIGRILHRSIATEPVTPITRDKIETIQVVMRAYDQAQKWGPIFRNKPTCTPRSKRRSTPASSSHVCPRGDHTEMEEDEEDQHARGTKRPRQETSSSSACSSPARSPSDRWEASPTGDPPQHAWSLWGPTPQRPPAPEAHRGRDLHPHQAPGQGALGGWGPDQQVETAQIDDPEDVHELFEGAVETGATDYYLEADESDTDGPTTDSEQSSEIDYSTRSR